MLTSISKQPLEADPVAYKSDPLFLQKSRQEKKLSSEFFRIDKNNEN